MFVVLYFIIGIGIIDNYGKQPVEVDIAVYHSELSGIVQPNKNMLLDVEYDVKKVATKRNFVYEELTKAINNKVKFRENREKLILRVQNLNLDQNNKGFLLKDPLLMQLEEGVILLGQ